VTRGVTNTTFNSGLRRPVGKVSAAYPDTLPAGYNLVFYMESLAAPNDLCYSDEWARTDNVPSDYRDKWWLCYYMAKYGYAVENATTAAILDAASPNMTADEYLQTVVLPYMSVSLGPGYHEYNTCQYIPMGSNTATFNRTLSATKQVDCSATDANAGTRAILTSCDVAFFSETDQRTSYFDTRPREWNYTCYNDDRYGSTKTANVSYVLSEYYEDPRGLGFEHCLGGKKFP